QDEKLKRRCQFVANIAGEKTRMGDNLLTISLAPPTEFNKIVMDARIDTVPPLTKRGKEDIVMSKAVVCDQCSSLSGNRHACVYACPHEAAMRIDGWVDLKTLR